MVQGQGTKDSASFHQPSAENLVKDWPSIALPTREILSPQSVPPLRKLAQASYPYPSEGTKKKHEFQFYGLQNENYNHRKLNNMITWITALCNSWNYQSCHSGHPRWISHDGEILWWRRNGEPLQHSCLENPMNSVKRQKYIILKDETPGLVGVQCATRKDWRNSSKRKEEAEPKQKQHPIMDVSSGGSKTWCWKE